MPIAQDSLHAKVIADLRQLEEYGQLKHGTPLTHDAKLDWVMGAYITALRLCLQLRGQLEKRDG